MRRALRHVFAARKGATLSIFKAIIPFHFLPSTRQKQTNKKSARPAGDAKTIALRSVSVLLIVGLFLSVVPQFPVQAQTNPQLILTKSIEDGVTTAQVGDTLRYRIRFECSSLVGPCGNMEITDILPDGLIYNPPPESSVPAGFTMSYNSGTRTVTITKDDFNLLDGSQYDAVLSVTVDYDFRPLPQSINNTVTGRIDPNHTNTWLEATPADAPPVQIQAVTADWSMTKSLASPTINPTVDTDVTYRLRLCPTTNSGNAPIRDVVMTDNLPANTIFVSASDGGTESGGVVTWPTVAGPVYPPNCITRYVTIQYPSSIDPNTGDPYYEIGDSITNTATGNGEYTDNYGIIVPPVDLDTEPITHDIDPIVETPTYSKNDTGDPVGITGTGRFVLNLNTNATNYPSNDAILIDNLPAELEVMEVTSGAWNASFAHVIAYVEYSTDLGTTYTPFSGTPASYNSNTTYTAPAANITNVRWRFMYDPDGAMPYTYTESGLPYSWSFTTSPQIRITPRSIAATADDAGSTVLPAAVGGSTYTNCLQVSRTDSTGNPTLDACDNENLTVEGNIASIRVSKSETPGTGWDDLFDPNINNFEADTAILPGDTVRYQINVELTERSSAPLINPTIQDTMPADLIFVRNGTAQLDGVDLAVQPNFTQVGDVLTWAWDSPSPELIVNPQTYGSHRLTVEFYARVQRGQTPGTYTNDLIVVTDSDAVECEIPTQITDTTDIDGDGNTTEYGCQAPDTYVVERSAALRGEKWVRATDPLNATNVDSTTFLPDATCPDGGSVGLPTGGSNTFTRYPCIAQVVPEGALEPGQYALTGTPSTTLDNYEYNLRVFNDGNVPMLEYVLYDILPYVGDTGSGGTLAGTARDSEFRAVLSGPVEFISGPAGLLSTHFTIQYNETVNPCRPEVFNEAPGTGIPTGCDDTWVDAGSVSDWSAIRSYRIRLNNDGTSETPAIDPSSTSDEVRFGVPMYIPKDSPVVGVFDDDDAVAHEIAWNSFSHVGSYDKDETASIEIQDLLASEPRKVGVTLPEVMSVGNRVWRDSDNSGTINGPDDSNPGIADVTVNLYRDTNQDGIPDGAAIASTLTDSEGYYLFSNIPYDRTATDANHYVIGIPASNFDEATDALYMLRSSTGTPATTTYTDPTSNVADSADDGIDPTNQGEEVFSYSFTLNPETEPESESDLSNNDRDGPEGRRRGLNGEIDQNSDLTIDFGFFGGIDIPFSIGNHVWYDNGDGGGTINDGIRQAGEPPVAGVTVRIYRDGNFNGTPESFELVQIDITDANGFYLFDNLDPGPYYVEIPASEFTGTAPLAGWYSSQTIGTENVGVPGNTNTPSNDSDDNGIDTNLPETYGVFSGEILLERGIDETLNETHVSGEADPGSPANEVLDPTGWDGPESRGRFGETDATSNLTVDFGFIPPMSLGNRVWIDEGSGSWNATDGTGVPSTFRTGFNNGIQDGTEAGVSGVVVQLWRDTNGNGTLDTAGDTLIRSTSTDANGYYLFDRIQPGDDYFVRVPPSEFGSGEPLYRYVSSYDSNQTTAPADDNEDMDDNGIDNAAPATNGITSSQITMAYTTEPLTPGDETDISSDATAYGPNNVGLFGQSDENSNLTMDFGFVRPPRSIGNRLWFDDNNNGILDGGESPVAGARVSLYLDTNNNDIPDDLGVIGNNTDNWIAYDITDANGYYLFDNLPANRYIVGVDYTNFAGGGVLEGYNSSTGYVDNASNNADSRDNGVDRLNRADPVASPYGIISTDLSLLNTPVNAPTGETGSGDTNMTAGNNPTAGDGTNSRGRNEELDNNSDLTMDFGFFQPMSLGNRIWRDNGDGGGVYNDGIMNGTEAGISGVRVEIYHDDNSDGVPDGASFRYDTTDANGFYLFDNLAAGNYVVGIPASNFSSGPLTNLISSIPDSTENSGVSGNPYTPNMDRDDNGINAANPASTGVFSSTIPLVQDNETSGETELSGEADTGSPTNININPTGWDGPNSIGRFEESDVNSNVTIDFGFVSPPRSLGNFLWLDDDNNGTYDAGESPVPAGVRVSLYMDTNQDGQPDDLGVIGDRSDDWIRYDETDANGYYLFDNLEPDYYLVGVDSSNFASGSLVNYISSSDYVDNASNNTDSLDNGVDEMHPATSTFGILSTTIDLTPATLNAPTGETLSGDTSTTLGDNPTAGDGTGSIGRYGEVDAYSDLTIDFGFFRPMSLGNRVFLDNGEGGGVYNNGIMDGGETGVANVRVELYFDDNADGVPEGLFGFDVTDANGYYLFDNVPEGTYVVQIAASNFAVSGALSGLSSSTPTGSENIGVAGNPYTPSMDMDDNGINSGTPQTTGILSAPITLTYNTETTGETDVSGEADTGSPTNLQNSPTGWDGLNSIGRFDQTDANSNITVDFGFVPVFSLGNRVWFDTDNSRTINGTEVGVSGVRVQLFDADTDVEIPVGPDGILDTIDDATGGMLTDANGYYMFNNLQPGNYIVVLPESNFNSGGVLEGYYSSGTVRNNDGSLSEISPAAANSDIDSDDDGMLETSGTFTGAVANSMVTLGPAINAEPAGETDLAGSDQGQPDGQANMTVDFGFYTMRLGDLVWNDSDNSGAVNGIEVGFSGVDVQLWTADESLMLDSTTTDSSGNYYFNNLPQGDYIVRIPATEFEGTETLRDFRSSTGAGNAYEPASNPDALTVDNDDNGSETGGILGLGGYIQTDVFVMNPGGEQSTDNSIGLTTEFRVDFGLYGGPQVDLAITKDDGQDYYIAGGTLTYTIVVTNNGPADVSGAEVTDTPPAAITSWTWTCAPATPAAYNCDGGTGMPFSDFVDLPYLGSLTYTVQATLDAAAIGPLSNTAVITPPTGITETDTSNNTDTDTDLPAGITIVKDDGMDIVTLGTILTYHVRIENTGAVDLDSLTITDTLPSEVNFIRAYQGANNVPPTTIAGNVLTWSYTDTVDQIVDLTNLPYADTPVGNDVIEFDIEVEVIANPAGGSITNTIEVEDDTTGVRAQDDDVDTVLYFDSKDLTDTSEADSGSGTIADPEPVFIGEIVTYTTTIDIPAGTANNLQMVDIMDRGLAFVQCMSITGGAAITADPANPFATVCANPTVSAEPGGSVASEDQGRRIQMDFGNVSSSGSTDNTITIVYEAVVLDIASNYNGVDNLNNQVEFTWDVNNSVTDDSTPVTIDEPELTIEKTAQPTVAAYGTPIDFTLEISHAAISAAPAYDVILTDVLPTGLQYIVGSVTSSGLAPTSYSYDAATYTLTFSWDEFPLGATSTINFQAAFIGPSPVENEASLEWTSLEIDPQPSGEPVQRSSYNVNSTERWYDPLDQTINDYGVRDAIEIRTPSVILPLTGFIPGVQSTVPTQPEQKSYDDMNTMYLEIPKLGINIPIMGIPYVDENWDLTWLSDEAGYLEGTSFPGQLGNTALTAHVVLADGTPGPFHELNTLAWGDQIILHMDGQKYIYELRHNLTIYPNDYSMFYYDGYTWLTLITCEGFNEYTDSYDYRTLVKAVLIKTELE